MGKKNKATGLGRSIIRDRFGKQNKAGTDTFLHTSDLNDGYDWGRLNLQSVTEQNNLEDFLTTAELAGTEFTAEKMNIKVIHKDASCGLPDGEELERIQNLQRQHKDTIRIPRRPHWEKEMTTSEIDQNEKAAFLEWRRSLALLQEVDGIVLTPYEKNLDFWRQLWRVIERSDMIVQIVDARNPLLFYCPDLEAYVHEVDPNKQCVLLINKADFLTQSQRDTWAEYCNKKKIRVAFWSAMDETIRQEEAEKEELDGDKIDELTKMFGDKDNASDNEDSDIDDSIHGDNDMDDNENLGDNEGSDNKMDNCNKSNCEMGELSTNENIEAPETVSVKHDMDKKDCDSSNTEAMDSEVSHTDSGGNISCDNVIHKTGQMTPNTGHLYTGPELLEFFRSLNPNTKLTIVGMVGYPNVGKSSTINAILKMKKVPVSATPGRTKHFQTLFVENDLMLCDCPGLVFPSFVTTKAELVVSGILPIDQMRDHDPPSSLISRLIPRKHLEKTYGIIIAKPREGEDPHRAPTAEEFLNAYGAMRGFMNARGMPDCPRSSRYILKDYVKGKLLYCHPPPGIKPEEFNSFADSQDSTPGELPTCQLVPESSVIDKEFFEKKMSTSHTRTAQSGGKDTTNPSAKDKPWKKHNNGKKKEKLRRVYGYMDKH